LGVDNCRGLTGASLEACQKYRLTQGKNFELSKSGFIQQIDLTLQPNVSIKNIIADSIETLQIYINWAKLAYGILSDLRFVSICRTTIGNESINKIELMRDIDKSIKQEESLINRLKTDQINNQKLIDELQSAQNQINALLITEIEKMIPIFDAISDKLDAAAAQNFQSSITAENTEIDNKTQTNLDQFGKQVKICQESK